MKKQLLIVFISIMILLTSCSLNQEEKSTKQEIDYPIIIHLVADYKNKNFLACFIGSDNIMHSAKVTQKFWEKNKEYIIERTGDIKNLETSKKLKKWYEYAGGIKKVKTLKQFKECYKYAKFESKMLDKDEVYRINSLLKNLVTRIGYHYDIIEYSTGKSEYKSLYMEATGFFKIIEAPKNSRYYYSNDYSTEEKQSQIAMCEVLDIINANLSYDFKNPYFYSLNEYEDETTYQTKTSYYTLK